MIAESGVMDILAWMGKEYDIDEELISATDRGTAQKSISIQDTGVSVQLKKHLGVRTKSWTK